MHKFIKDEHEDKCPKCELPYPNNSSTKGVLSEDMEACDSFGGNKRHAVLEIHKG